MVYYITKVNTSNIIRNSTNGLLLLKRHTVKKRELSEEVQTGEAEALRSIYYAKKKKLGLNQEEVSNQLGITQGAVSHYLTGKNPLNLHTGQAFAKMLEVSLQDFSTRLYQESLVANKPTASTQKKLLDTIQDLDEEALIDLIQYAEFRSTVKKTAH